MCPIIKSHFDINVFTAIRWSACSWAYFNILLSFEFHKSIITYEFQKSRGFPNYFQKYSTLPMESKKAPHSATP